MAASDPAISWLHAYPLLPILASNTMAQPAGRLLGTPAMHSAYQRASPILCALDALALIVRCIAYCVVLRATPRQALVLIGTDRFVEPESESEGGDAGSGAPETEADTTVVSSERGTTSRLALMMRTATMTAVRLAGFGLGVVPLVGLTVQPAEHAARWTAAWGWMFVSSYVLLELAALVHRWEMAKPQYTPADFELEVVLPNDPPSAEEGDDGDDDDELSCTEMAAGPRGSDVLTDVGREEAGQDETTDLLRYRDTDDEGRTPNRTEGVGYDGSVLAPAINTTPPTLVPGPSSSDERDLEAAKVVEEDNTAYPYEYNDLATHPRLPALNTNLARVDSLCLWVGWPLHTVLLYWAFLDLVQPLINANILAVDVDHGSGWEIATSWNIPLSYLRLPFTFGCEMLILVLGFVLGWVVMQSFIAIGNLVVAQLPQSVRTCRQGTVELIIKLGSGALCGLTLFISVFAGFPYIGKALLSPHMLWVWSMLSLETVVFLLFLGGCFVFYLLLKGAAAAAKAKWAEHNSSLLRQSFQYIQEDGVALLSVVLLTLLLSLLWYRFRFTESAHWAQNWRDALVANVTSTNGTATDQNGTTTNATMTNDTMVKMTEATLPWGF